MLCCTTIKLPPCFCCRKSFCGVFEISFYNEPKAPRIASGYYQSRQLQSFIDTVNILYQLSYISCHFLIFFQSYHLRPPSFSDISPANPEPHDNEAAPLFFPDFPHVFPPPCSGQHLTPSVYPTWFACDSCCRQEKQS